MRQSDSVFSPFLFVSFAVDAVALVVNWALCFHSLEFSVEDFNRNQWLLSEFTFFFPVPKSSYIQSWVCLQQMYSSSLIWPWLFMLFIICPVLPSTWVMLCTEIRRNKRQSRIISINKDKTVFVWDFSCHYLTETRSV